ncbi:MAG: carboxypeptidase regulatory-like domain-containing protein [Terriglobia bacterium]
MIKPKFLLAVTVAFLLLLVACGGEEATAPAGTAEPEAQPTAARVDPATAATITGTVKFAGSKPRRNRLRMDADAQCAKLHSAPVYSEQVVVNDNGTLRDVFVYVKDGLGGARYPAPSEPVVLDQQGCVYTPHVVGAVANQEIHILNSDPTTHNIHPVPKNNREWNTSMPPGADKLVRKFPRQELMVPIKCNIHPWMRSYVGVLDHPFFAVSGADGSFEITGLPPGEYTLAAWQEKYGTAEQQVTVGAKETKSVEFQFSPSGAGD